jgi:hypothetical protein
MFGRLGNEWNIFLQLKNRKNSYNLKLNFIVWKRKVKK